MDLIRLGIVYVLSWAGSYTKDHWQWQCTLSTHVTCMFYPYKKFHTATIDKPTYAWYWQCTWITLSTQRQTTDPLMDDNGNAHVLPLLNIYKWLINHGINDRSTLAWHCQCAYFTPSTQTQMTDPLMYHNDNVKVYPFYSDTKWQFHSCMTVPMCMFFLFCIITNDRSTHAWHDNMHALLFPQINLCRTMVMCMFYFFCTNTIDTSTHALQWQCACFTPSIQTQIITKNIATHAWQQQCACFTPSTVLAGCSNPSITALSLGENSWPGCN